jgi:TRAP-type C4-dicarboxylate transport system substrate-binding protein
MLLSTPEEFEKAQAAMAPYIERAYAKKGIVVLGTYYFPLQVAWSRNKLTELADMAGQKLRVTSPEQGEFVKRFGGVPVTIGASEVATALDRGVVSGVFTASSGGGKVWKDLLKYSYRLGPNYFDAIVIANKAAFDKLPPASQEALRGALRAKTPWITAEMKKEEDEVTAQMAKDGMVVTPAKPADVKAGADKMAGFWDEWAKGQGAEAVEALGKVRAAVGR